MGAGGTGLCKSLGKEGHRYSGDRSRSESREKNAQGVPCGQKHRASKRQQGDERGSLGPCVLDSLCCLLAARAVLAAGDATPAAGLEAVCAQSSR